MNVRRVLPRDAIPSVDDPSFVACHPGDDGDDVIGLVREGTARAYPVRYLHYHEVVNDVVGGVPVAVTWCPLCGSAVVYDRRVGGRTLEFGVSGKLADDDLVLYDRGTDSEWKQSSGACIDGPLTGERLDALPARVTTWAEFRDAEPDAVVLEAPGGRSEAAGDGDDPDPISYDENPYAAYFERPGFGLDAHRGTGGREWGRDDLDPKAVVLGVERGAEALGVPLPVVEREGGVVTATVGDTDVVVFATDAGVFAFEHPGLSFDAVDGGFRADGTTWDGATGRAADGRSLERLPARRLFAFGWQDDHGPDAFYGL